MLLVAGIDFDVEIKQLRATMKTIGQVLDLDGMRAEIADLGEQVAAPDLWDDQENATRVTGRLSGLQGQLDRFTELDGRIDDVEIMVQLSQEENDASSLSDAENELGKIHNNCINKSQVSKVVDVYPILKNYNNPINKINLFNGFNTCLCEVSPL